MDYINVRGKKVFVDKEGKPVQWHTERAYDEDGKFNSAGSVKVSKRDSLGRATHITDEEGEHEVHRDSLNRIIGIGDDRNVRPGSLNLD